MATGPTNSNFEPQVGVQRTSGLQTSGGAGVQATTVLPGTKDDQGFKSSGSNKSSSSQSSNLAFSLSQSRSNPGGGENFDKNA